MFIVPTIIGTEPPCSSARKKDVERNRHSFPLTKIVAVLLFIEEIYEMLIPLSHIWFHFKIKVSLPTDKTL